MSPDPFDDQVFPWMTKEGRWPLDYFKDNFQALARFAYDPQLYAGSPLSPQSWDRLGSMRTSLDYHLSFSETCDLNCSDTAPRVNQDETPLCYWGLGLFGIALIGILLAIVRHLICHRGFDHGRVLRVQGRRISRSSSHRTPIYVQPMFLIWLITFQHVEGICRDINCQVSLRHNLEEDRAHIPGPPPMSRTNSLSSSYVADFRWHTKTSIEPTHFGTQVESGLSFLQQAHLYEIPSTILDDQVSLFQSGMDLDISPRFLSSFEAEMIDTDDFPRLRFTTGPRLLPRIRDLLEPILSTGSSSLWSLYLLDARGTEIYALKSQHWPSAANLEAIYSLFNGIDSWLIGELAEDSLSLCLRPQEGHLHLVLYFPLDFEAPLIGKIQRTNSPGVIHQAFRTTVPTTKDDIVQSLGLSEECDHWANECIVASEGITFSRILGYDVSAHLEECALVDITIRDNGCDTMEPRYTLTDFTSFMQQEAAKRRIVKLWGMSWRDRFSLHWHTWSHLEGSTLSSFHLPDSREVPYSLVAIQGKEGTQQIAHDHRIELPVYMEISCISSDRGVISWLHQRASNAYSFVIALCSNEDYWRDWTCWAENPNHIPGGADIPVVPGSFVKVYQRERAPETSEDESFVPSTPSGSIIPPLPSSADEAEEEDDYCTLFQRTFVGSHHEGLDWAERDLPRGEWALHMERSFLEDVQYIRQHIVPQPGVKFIRISRLHVNPAWTSGTLSWEMNQASPMRIMRDIQSHWPDVQGDWKLHALDTTCSALYALEELILILELPNHDWDADRRLPHLFERIAIHGSTIKVNAIAKILESPTTKRDIILAADMVGCTHYYACEVWLQGKRLLTSDQIWLHVSTLIQVVRTLGGNDMPLLLNPEELSIPSGTIRFWPSHFYSVLRQYGHPWKIMVFRDSSRAVPPEFESMLQIFQQPETLTAHCLNTWPTLRITDWRSISVDDSAYSSGALRDFDALYVIAELHTETSWRLVLLERLIETASLSEIQVVAHRMLTPISREDLIFSLDAERICAQPDKECQTECNGQALLEGGRHNAADGDFCRLHVTSFPTTACSNTNEVTTDQTLDNRDRSRSPLKRRPLSRTLYRTAGDSDPPFSSLKHRSHEADIQWSHTDMHSLMQWRTEINTVVPMTHSPSWFYVFKYGHMAPVYIRSDEQGPIEEEEFVRETIRNHEPSLPYIEIMVRKVIPQPNDLWRTSINAYVAVDFAELGPYLLPVLLDVWWVSHLRAAPQRPLTLWRQTKLAQFRSDRSSFLDQVGLASPCNVVQEACRVRHRGLMWDPSAREVRRLAEGDFVEVWIHSPFPQLSITGQWLCFQEGCEINDFPRHIRQRVHDPPTQPNHTFVDYSSFMQTSRRTSTQWFYVYQTGTEDPHAFSLTHREARSPLSYIEHQIGRRIASWNMAPGFLAMVSPLPSDLLREGILAAVIHEPTTRIG